VTVRLTPATPLVVPPKSGWFVPVDGQGGSRTMVYQQLWLYPFDLQRAGTIASISCNVTTGGTAGSTIRLCAFSSDRAGGVGSLLLDAGTVAGDSTGVKTVSSLTTATPADRLWLGAAWQGTNTSAPVLQAYSKALSGVSWSSFVQFPPIIGYTWTGISGTLPATLGAPAGNENNNVPSVQLTFA
jgi:hypothetical protein